MASGRSIRPRYTPDAMKPMPTWRVDRLDRADQSE